MKVIVLTFAFVVAGFSYSFAQSETEMGHPTKKEKLSPEERTEKKVEHMTKELNLTQEQADKAKTIILAHEKEMEKIHEQHMELKKKGKAQREETKSKLDEILTEEQKEIHEKKMEEHKAKRKEMRCKKCCEDKKQ